MTLRTWASNGGAIGGFLISIVAPLILNGYNTFSGGITVNQGEVQFGNPNAFGTGTLTLAGTCAANGRPARGSPVAVSVNLTAAFEMSHEAAKVMIPQRSGKMINICSMFSFLGGRLSPAYAATKHGIAGLTKAYCDELAIYGIQVNGIAPGYFATEMNRALVDDAAFSDWVCKRTPAGRWGRVEELGGAAVFLLPRRRAS